MRRATVTLSDDLNAVVEAYQESFDAPPTLNALVTAALNTYLSDRGYLPRRGPFRLTPAPAGSGWSDISVEHDREMAAE